MASTICCRFSSVGAIVTLGVPCSTVLPNNGITTLVAAPEVAIALPLDAVVMVSEAKRCDSARRLYKMAACRACNAKVRNRLILARDSCARHLGVFTFHMSSLIAQHRAHDYCVKGPYAPDSARGGASILTWLFYPCPVWFDKFLLFMGTARCQQPRTF